MIIDFHTHIGTTVGKSKEDLLASMDEAKIDKSVIIAGNVVGIDNNRLIETLDKQTDRFLGIIAASPLEIGVKPDYIDRITLKNFEDLLKHPSVVGAKFYTGYDQYYANDERVEHFLYLLEKHNKVAVFHLGDTYCVHKGAKLKYAHPLPIDDIATDWPDLKIVMAHYAYPWHKDAAQIMYKNSNVYADVSGFVYGEFKEKDAKNFKKVLEEVEMIYDNNWDRVLFGTDWPLSNQTSYCKTLKELDLFECFNANTNKLINEITTKRK